MNNQQLYCKNCLAKATHEHYCDACGKKYDKDKVTGIISREDIPNSYIWYGLLLAPIVGFISYFIVYTFFTGDLTMKKMGGALYFIVPISTGAMFGYFMRPVLNLINSIFMTLVLTAILVALVYYSKSAGLACASVLLAIFIVPIYLSTLVGRFIRRLSVRHIRAQFQSSPLVFLFLLPVSYGAIEEQYFEKTTIRTITTQIVINAAPSEVWRSVRFCEHVKQDLPLILKIGLPIPLRAIGNHKKVGDITSCEYEGGGFIRKIITRLVDQQE